MKCLIVAAAITSFAGASEEAYAQPQNSYNYNKYFEDPYVYDARTNQGGYGYGSSELRVPAAYGESPYGALDHQYDPYGHTQDYIEPVYPPKQKPNPFIDFPPDEESGLRLPNLGHYHCFLHGAPWTNCGRRSLTSYFLEQCMSFYYALSTSVDGICGGEPPAEPAHDPYASDYEEYPEAQPAAPYYPPQQPSHYGPQPAAAPAYKPTEAAKPTPETTTGYSGALIQVYQKERCLQNAYVSITAALVMCLTENMIRIKYIEHYAKDAATNPIEGPMLYLRKLHTFIESVLDCNNDGAKYNYPNLWSEFRNSDGVLTYNPNAPYELVDGRVTLPQYTNGEASGWNDVTTNDYFICSDFKYVNGDGVYEKCSDNSHYKKSYLDSCSWSKANKKIGDVAYKHCDNALRKKKGHEHAGHSDMTLRGLYDSVAASSSRTVSAFRIRTIAENAVRAGVLEQPLLEGFGIMYFCAFYACKANNGGALDGTCFPSFDADSDWNVPAEKTTLEELNEWSDKIEYCLGKKWLVRKDVYEDEKVRKFIDNLNRPYLCMAEREIVDFWGKIAPSQGTEKAWDLVYFRHMAVEKCYYEEHGKCKWNKKLYRKLAKALKSLVDTCLSRKAEYGEARAKHSSYYSSYHQPAPYYQQQRAL